MALQTVNQFDIGTNLSNLGTGFAQGQQFGLARQAGQRAQAQEQRAVTTEDQVQSDLRSSTINELAINISKLPFNQRASALAQAGDRLTSVNIDPAVFAGQDLTDTVLAEIIAGTGGVAEVSALDLAKTAKLQAEAGQVGVPKVAAKTSAEKNAIAVGLTPGTPEFVDFITKAVTKPSTIIQKGQTAEEIALAKLGVKRFSDVQQAADGATKLLENLDQLASIDVESGALEPAKATLAAIIEGFGLDASGIANATNAQAFNAVSGRLVNEVLNAATGPQTDQDATRARKTIASLGDTPGALVFKNASLKAVALRQIDQRDFINERLDSGDTLRQANKRWRAFKNKTPSLSSVVKKDGLPMFFYQFKESAKQRRPGISDDEIIKAWRGAHAK
jgi:hypothetical protein